jgi:peptide subunit release factor 1 (eRF1)
VDVDGVLTLRAADGALAECHRAPGVRTTKDVDAFVAAAAKSLRIGLLLARKASVAVGVAVGSELVVHKIDTAYVQSRTAAGGWSQHRFARRRDNQAKAAAGDASDLVLRLLVPEAPKLATLVTGGDRRTVESILADRRLSALAALVADRFLEVAEPRLAVLQSAVAAAQAVRIKVTDPVPQ